MLVEHLYQKGYVEYPINFDLKRRTFHVDHETCFCPYFTSWCVTLLETGDMVYIPAGQNRSRYIYIVSWDYTRRAVSFPRGIYKIPISYFTHREELTSWVL